MTELSHQKFYSILYILSLIIFFLNFLIQNQIVFSFEDVYGLIFKMNWLFWVGYFILITLIYFQFKYFEKIDEKFVYFTLFLLVLYLIATPFFYEHLPRFEDTWGHSYFVSQIFYYGKINNGLSGYENFPGSFLFYGVLFQDIPYFIMKLSPFIFYFIGMIIIYVLFRLIISSKVSFLTSVFYMFFNWTVEDNHLSPQFLFILIYFVFLYIIVKSFKTWRNKKNILEKNLLLTTLFSFVIIFSHPGTSIFLLLILISLYILCKEFRKILLPVIIIHLSIFLIYNFYLGVLNGYLQYIKDFVNLLVPNKSFSQVSQRFVLNIFSRNLFLTSRLLITIFSVLIGLCGIILLYLKKSTLGARFFLAWSFCMLVFSIFVGLVLKGEYYERFVLISSLPLAALTAYFLNDLKHGAIIVLIILLLISPLYFVAKYGNEAFESISSEKLQADCFNNNFYSNCEDRQEIVNSAFYQLSSFGKRSFSISREEIMANMISLGKDRNEIEMMIRDIAYNQTLDRIYSTYSSAVFR